MQEKRGVKGESRTLWRSSAWDCLGQFVVIPLRKWRKICHPFLAGSHYLSPLGMEAGNTKLNVSRPTTGKLIWLPLKKNLRSPKWNKQDLISCLGFSIYKAAPKTKAESPICSKKQYLEWVERRVCLMLFTSKPFFVWSMHVCSCRWWCSIAIPQTFGKKIWSNLKPSYFSTEQCKDLVCLGSIYKGSSNPVMWELYITNIGSILQDHGQYEDFFFGAQLGCIKSHQMKKVAWKTSTQLKDIPQLRLQITKKKHTPHMRHIWFTTFMSSPPKKNQNTYESYYDDIFIGWFHHLSSEVVRHFPPKNCVSASRCDVLNRIRRKPQAPVGGDTWS